MAEEPDDSGRNDDRLEIPHDDNLERCAVGGLLTWPEDLPTVAARLSESLFYRQRHRRIVRAMLECYQAGTPVDALAVMRQLRRDGADAETQRYLALLVGEAYTNLGPARASIPWYIDLLHQVAASRQAIVGLSSLLGEAREGLEAAEIAGKLRTIETDLEQTLEAAKLKSSSDVSQELVNRMEGIYHANTLAWQPTGLRELDDLLHGLRPTHLTILAARPSMGKTTLATDIAANIAAAGKPVYIASLESAADMMQARIAAKLSSLSCDMVLSAQVSDWQLRKWEDALVKVKDWPIWFEDSGRSTVAQIEAHARQVMGQNGGSLALIVVDYLQLLDPGPGERGENRQVQVARISRDLKRLAMSLKVPVLALSQLSRATESREGAKPRLADLRESGAIEQDADEVLMLYRADMYRKDGEQRDGTAEVIVEKNRHGRTGVAELRFESYVPAFMDAEEEEREVEA